jgi:8-oxo-dGTP pyrophosphatase MutT (NUDIX family)
MVNRNYSGVIIENHKGKLLFQLRDNKSGLPHANKWSLFGGGIELGENPIQAITREIKEELGFDLVPENLKLLLRKETKKEKRYVFYYKLREDFAKLKIGEGQRFEFLQLHEILLKKNVVPSLRLFMCLYPFFKLLSKRQIEFLLNNFSRIFYFWFFNFNPLYKKTSKEA